MTREKQVHATTEKCGKRQERDNEKGIESFDVAWTGDSTLLDTCCWRMQDDRLSQ